MAMPSSKCTDPIPPNVKLMVQPLSATPRSRPEEGYNINYMACTPTFVIPRQVILASNWSVGMNVVLRILYTVQFSFSTHI